MNHARHGRPIDVAAPEFRVVRPNTVLDGLNAFPTLSDTRSRNLLIALSCHRARRLSHFIAGQEPRPQ